MDYRKKLFAVVSGLHTDELKQEIMDLLRGNAEEQLICLYDPDADLRLYEAADGDLHARLRGRVEGRDVYVLQEMGSEPWKDLAAVCIAAACAKRNKASRVTAVIPVWTTGRHGNPCPGESDILGSSGLAAGMLRSGSVDRLVTMTPAPVMLTSAYPVQVEVPDISEALKEHLTGYLRKTPILLADEPDSFSFAEQLGRKTGWQVALCWFRENGHFYLPNIGDAETVICTNRFHSRLTVLAKDLIDHGIRIAGCFSPQIARPEMISDDVYKLFGCFLTLDRRSGCVAETLPTGKIIVNWIIRDRTEDREKTDK